MRKKVLLINIGWEQEPLIDKLLELDVELYGVHYDSNYYDIQKYKELLITDLRDLDDIMRFAEKIKPDAVISDQCDYSHFAQAVISEKLNLSGPSIKQAQISSNKYLQKMECSKHDILIPDYKLCTNIEDIRSFIKESNFPIIIKPIDNRGSFGVNKVISEDEIPEAYFDAIINSHSRLVLVEKFIEGIHITIDGYCFPKHGCKSLALATKILDGIKRQVAIDIIYPGELESEIYSQAFNLNEIINKKLGFNFGMLHSEYMISNDNQIYLIESANRGGGVYTSEIIVPEVSGIDLVSQYINDCLGKSKDLFKPISYNDKVLLKFFSFKPGKIRAINGFDELISKPEILKARLAVKPGEEILPITTDANRHGFIIIKGKDNIRMDSENILKTVEVIYE